LAFSTAKDATASGTPIETGTFEVTADVRVVFAID
jgi:uncharacterized protein YggE